MASAPAYQRTPDQADPTVIEDDLRREDRAQPKARPTIEVSRPEAGTSAITEDVIVGAIRVDGASALPPAAFARVVESYVGRTLTARDLTSLASDIADIARSAGFGLATAWIPPQRVSNGILHVVVDEGRIDAVEVTGNGEAAVRPYLEPLARGGAVKTAVLERQLVLAGDVPGIRMGKARLQRRGGRSILMVQAARDRVRGSASIDNWGSSAVGPVRARLTADINGILAEDDRLTIGGSVTPMQPREFALAHLSYTKVLGGSGTEVTVGGYVARSEPGGVLKDLDIKGVSSEIEFGVRHPFLRSRFASLWGSLDFRLRDSSQSRGDVRIRDDRIATITAGGLAVHRGPDARARARFSLAQGLDVLDATRRGDPLASRPDGSAVFTKLELWLEYEQQLGRGLSLFGQAEGQVANRPLLSSEEMGLGGRYFGRAWDYREFSGDKGVAGSLELRFDLKQMPGPIGDAQLYAYADAGRVSNYEGGFGGGSLASAGGGIRLWLDGGIQASLEAGFPLTDGADPAADREPRFSFTLGTRF
ncbi:MAG TPA: ShlB/FhaC/HecB family hemolysin secretion/activation protein [Allosphingosinicella sp.]